MMTVYRISHEAFISDLEGIGARKYGGRWNPAGIACLYCSEHLSLALLEKFVHAQGKDDMINLASLSLKIPAAAELYMVNAAKLDPNWPSNISYTQWLGRQILEDLSYAGFVVPSIIVPGEMNIVLNPAAPSFKKITTSQPTAFVVDNRLVAQI
jgi:RES domain-containing protein